MDEIDQMEALGLPVERWAGARIWDSLDFLAMLRLRKWKQNVRGHDSTRGQYVLQACEHCGLKQKRQLSRHHVWDELHPHASRDGKVTVLCKPCHAIANRKTRRLTKLSKSVADFESAFHKELE